jgi:hypothetical protein
MLKVHDLYENEVSEIHDLRNSVRELTKRLDEQAISNDRVRRCLFAKIDFLENYCLQMYGQRILEAKEF